MGNVLLLTMSLLAGGLVAEAVSRVFFADEIDTARLAERNAHTSFGAFTRPSAVPGLVYELRPGAIASGNGLPGVAISALGPYRIAGPSREPEASEGALRFAVIGDSTSFGWRVGFDQSYPELVRRELEARLGRHVVLRNLSVPGYDSAQERLVFERQALPWRPDFVLLHYDHNDWEPEIREKPATYLDPEYGDNPLRSGLIKLVARRLRIAGARRERQALDALEHRLLDGYAYEGPLYDRHLEALHGIAEEASAQGIPVLCVVFDAVLKREAEPLEGEHYRLLHRRLTPALIADGFHVLELFHADQRLMADQDWDDLSLLWVAPDDAHPSPLGHALIAQAIGKYLDGDAELRRRLAGSE